MASIGENAAEKKHQKIEFYQSKFPTWEHPKKYQKISLVIQSKILLHIYIYNIQYIYNIYNILDSKLERNIIYGN